MHSIAKLCQLLHKKKMIEMGPKMQKIYVFYQAGSFS